MFCLFFSVVVAESASPFFFLSFVNSSKLYSIIGVCISIISFAGTFIRSQLFNSSSSMMFDELPQVDALWYFLNDIYFIRTVHEYTIENDFFNRLI